MNDIEKFVRETGLEVLININGDNIDVSVRPSGNLDECFGAASAGSIEEAFAKATVGAKQKHSDYLARTLRRKHPGLFDSIAKEQAREAEAWREALDGTDSSKNTEKP